MSSKHGAANQTELYNLDMDLTSRITIDPEQCGGRPCIRHMRIRVIDVLDLLAAGLTATEITEELPDLETDDVAAALQFAIIQLEPSRSVA
jgi:uncharacterized protein (DUF433 family)